MKRRRLLFALTLILYSVALGGFTLPDGESADTDKLIIRVTAPEGTEASFDVLFKTRTDTLVSQKGIATPKTFEIKEPQFGGYVRPLEDAMIKVEVTQSNSRSSRSARRPISVTRNSNGISVGTLSPDDI